MKTKPSSASNSSDPQETARFFSKLGLFLALTAVILVGLEWLTKAMFDDLDAQKYAAMSQGDRPHRNLILGSSTAQSGIHPAHLEKVGLAVYNFAYAGGNPVFFRQWYRLYRETNPAPELVLYSTDWFMFQQGMLERQLERDAEYLPLPTYLRLFWAANAAYPSLLTNRFAFIKQRHQLRNALFLQRDERTTPYHQGCHLLPPGYRKLPLSVSSELNPRAIADFQALLDTFATEGVRVVFVQPPNYLPDAGEHPVEQARLTAFAQARGIPYLNYNGERRSALNDDRRCFSDRLHINAHGAERFSRRLGQDLKALGLLPG